LVVSDEKKPQGFAAMPKEKVRELASRGGRAGVNRHQFTSEEAKIAGKKGGDAYKAKMLARKKAAE
jgi:general stress protein YciG